MESLPNYWKDHNGNLWSKANYTEEEALAESKTLLQCRGCLDSKNLDHCNFCNYCEDCTACHDCTSCIDSAGLAHCLGCSDCFDSAGLCFCKNLSGLRGRIAEEDLKMLADIAMNISKDVWIKPPEGRKKFQRVSCEGQSPTLLSVEAYNA